MSRGRVGSKVRFAIERQGRHTDAKLHLWSALVHMLVRCLTYHLSLWPEQELQYEG